MRVGVVVAILALGGCSFSPGRLPAGSDDADIDSPDTPGDTGLDSTPCSAWMPAPKHFMPCAIPAPVGSLIISAADSPWTLDTQSGILSNASVSQVAVAFTGITQSGGPDAYLISVDLMSVEPGASLTVVGNRPLIVASFSSITIHGTVDATSKVGSSAGAGANPDPCTTNAPSSGQGALGVDDASGGGGSGGGGGGGFRSNGGMGGPGDSGAENAGGAGGSGTIFPTFVRGGCSGGASGLAGPDGADPNRRAAGGAGGGAIQLTARSSITFGLGGRLLAGGAGGAGSATGDASGGGGGGSGGYLGLQAPMVSVVDAVVAANGGGGGGSNLFSGTGAPGQDGQPTAVAAIGGAASSCSNAGGVGSANATLAGTSASQSAVACGGGGGGGAAGFIGVFTSVINVTGATISPPHQLNPF